MNWSSLVRGSAVVLLWLVAGCGSAGTEPPLAEVWGTVTVNGLPGTDLDIIFEPQAPPSGSAKDIGAVSIARTDAEGYYELRYKGSTKGAVVGKHLVRIGAVAGGGPAGGETGAVAQFEMPPEYSSQSKVIRDVQKGENQIDLQITIEPRP